MAHERILVVDDDPLIREIMQGLFGDTYELALAASGEEALEIAERTHPDVVLMDVMMPGIDGHEACQRIREIKGLESTKIILVSGDVPAPEQLGGPPAGADDYLLKPINFGDVCRKIESVLQTH